MHVRLYGSHIRLVSIVCCVFYLVRGWMMSVCVEPATISEAYFQYIVQCEFYYVGFGISIDLTRTGGRWRCRCRCWFYLFLASIFPYTCTHIVNYVFVLFSYFLWPSSQNGMFNSIAMPKYAQFLLLLCFVFIFVFFWIWRFLSNVRWYITICIATCRL